MKLFQWMVDGQHGVSMVVVLILVGHQVDKQDLVRAQNQARLMVEINVQEIQEKQENVTLRAVQVKKYILLQNILLVDCL